MRAITDLQKGGLPALGCPAREHGDGIKLLHHWRNGKPHRLIPTLHCWGHAIMKSVTLFHSCKAANLIHGTYLTEAPLFESANSRAMCKNGDVIGAAADSPPNRRSNLPTLMSPLARLCLQFRPVSAPLHSLSLSLLSTILVFSTVFLYSSFCKDGGFVGLVFILELV